MIKQNSIPDYPHKHSGTLIILGSARCVFDDLDQIQAARAGAMYAGINEAAGVLPVHFVMSMHGENMARFKALRDRYPRLYTTHAVIAHKVAMQNFPKYPVDFWWNAHSGCTSLGSAILIGEMMGFDEAILCGCPLNGGDGYYRDTIGSTPEMKRIGFALPHDGMVQSYQTNFKAMINKLARIRVYSMSGFTMSVVGRPPDLKGADNVQ